ncbi:hypothetical protein B0H63DRAFT_110779 [Podospora didyma]|uniref:Uncharacterized protein n=1 Tax=Podospora didyma TaxID=330526 RepID=A0AAE0NZ12_9PEZI|nr:hypothetical protein B0H63DRAFT_110779 [Podospora didyma]
MVACGPPKEGSRLRLWVRVPSRSTLLAVFGSLSLPFPSLYLFLCFYIEKIVFAILSLFPLGSFCNSFLRGDLRLDGGGVKRSNCLAFRTCSSGRVFWASGTSCFVHCARIKRTGALTLHFCEGECYIGKSHELKSSTRDHRCWFCRREKRSAGAERDRG